MRERLATQAAVFTLMRQYDIHPVKARGQNFLTDPRVAEKMADSARISRDDCVIEIGPGLGALTQVLAEKAAAVLALEIDRNLTEILKDLFAGDSRVEIIQGDILKTNMKALMGERGWASAKLAANLPYYITTPIIMGLLESRCPISRMSVMVQREAAERLTAKPGGKEYGALSLAASYFTDVGLYANVPRNCFFPRPNVDSAIVTLDIYGDKGDVDNEETFFNCVRAAFGQRRKTLVNCLRSQDWIDKDRYELTELLKSCGFDEKIRGETLSLEDFKRLARRLNA